MSKAKIKQMATELRSKLTELKILQDVFKANYGTHAWQEIFKLLNADHSIFDQHQIAASERKDLTNGIVQELRGILRAESEQELKGDKNVRPQDNPTTKIPKEDANEKLREDFKRIGYADEQINGIMAGSIENKKQEDLTDSALKGEVTKKQFLDNSKFYR